MVFLDPTLRDLWRAVVDAPAERDRRLVLADRLDECGEDPALAEFVRLQLAPGLLGLGDAEAANRAAVLLESRHPAGDTCRRAWTWALRREARERREKRLGASAGWVWFSGGLPEEVRCPAWLWLAAWREFRRAAPLLRVALYPLPGPGGLVYRRRAEELALSVAGMESARLGLTHPSWDASVLDELRRLQPGVSWSWQPA